jgi:hypothetical protein
VRALGAAEAPASGGHPPETAATRGRRTLCSRRGEPIATIHQATRPTMRKLIAAAAILAAAGCGAGGPGRPGHPALRRRRKHRAGRRPRDRRHRPVRHDRPQRPAHRRMTEVPGPAYRIRTPNLLIRCWDPADARARARGDRRERHPSPPVDPVGRSRAAHAGGAHPVAADDALRIRQRARLHLRDLRRGGEHRPGRNRAPHAGRSRGARDRLLDARGADGAGVRDRSQRRADPRGVRGGRGGPRGDPLRPGERSPAPPFHGSSASPTKPPSAAASAPPAASPRQDGVDAPGRRIPVEPVRIGPA